MLDIFPRKSMDPLTSVSSLWDFTTPPYNALLDLSTERHSAGNWPPFGGSVQHVSPCERVTSSLKVMLFISREAVHGPIDEPSPSKGSLSTLPTPTPVCRGCGNCYDYPGERNILDCIGPSCTFLYCTVVLSNMGFSSLRSRISFRKQLLE